MIINDEFIEKLGVDFLWDIIDDYISKDIESIKDALIKNVGYVEIEAINKLTSAEVQESDEFIINEFTNDEGTLIIKFEMPAIIIAESDNEEVCLRITTSCEGVIEIPNVEKYDWSSLMLSKINEYTYIIKVISLSYEYIEADDLNA